MLVRPNNILVKDPKTVTFEEKVSCHWVLKSGIFYNKVQRLKILITNFRNILRHCLSTSNHVMQKKLQMGPMFFFFILKLSFSLTKFVPHCITIFWPGCISFISSLFSLLFFIFASLKLDIRE